MRVLIGVLVVAYAIGWFIALNRKLAADWEATPDKRMTLWLKAHPRRRHIPFIDD